METTPQKTLDGRLRKQLVRYGLGAAAATASAIPAASDANVITTNAGDITGDSIFFDLQGGLVSNTAGTVGATDFHLYINTFGVVAKPAIAAYTGATSAVLAMTRSAPFSPYAPRLHSGDTVGSAGQSFFNNARFDATTGQWTAGSRGFLGLSLSSGGNTFYGWADVSLNNLGGTNSAFTLHSFAFDDVAGEAVTINGPAAAPENGPTALLLLLGASGLIALRARGKQAA